MHGASRTDEPAAKGMAADNSSLARQTFVVHWIILGLALLAIGLLMTVNLFQNRTRTEQLARDRLSIGAQSLAQQVARRLKSIDDALLDLRNNLPVLQNQHDSEAHLAVHLKTLQSAVDGIRTIGVLDANGLTLASSRSELIGKNFAFREFFQAVAKSPKAGVLYVSEPFLTSLGTYSLNLSRATFDVSGRWTGIVTATLDPEAFKPMLAALRYTPDVSAGLIHGHGKVLLYSATPDIAPGTDLSDSRTFFAQHRQRGATNSLLEGTAPYLPNERLAALVRIAPRERAMSAPLVIAMSVERAGILSEWRLDFRNHVLLMAMLILFSVVSLIAYQRRQRQLLESDRRQQIGRRQDIDRLKLATEIGGIGIWELDLRSMAYTWDETMFGLYGRDRGLPSPTIDDWKECVLPEDRPGLESAFQDAVDHHQELDTVFRIRRADTASVRIIDARARVYYDERGSPSKMIGVNRDITERLAIQQSLQESKEFTVGILDSLTSHIAVLDTHGTIIAVNQAWRDFARRNGAPSPDTAYVGQSYLDVCGKPNTSGSIPEATPACLGIRQVLQGERREFGLEYPCHSPEQERWFFMRVTRLRGTIAGAVVSHQDITPRKLAERKLTEAMMTTQQFIEHLPGAAYVKDENLRVLMANQAFQNMLGLNPAAMLGRTNHDLFPGSIARKLDAEEKKALESGYSQSIDEDFSGRFFDTRKFVIKGANGKRLLGGITVEVTERQKSFERQEALLQIGKLAGQLPERAFLGECLELVKRLTGSNSGFIHFVNDDQRNIELATETPGALKEGAAAHKSRPPLGATGFWAECARHREVTIMNDCPKHQATMGPPDGHAHLQRFISVPVIDDGEVRVILGVGNKTSDYDEADCTTAQLIGNDLWRITRRMRAEAALKQKMEELMVLNERLDETNNRLLQSEKLASLGQLAAGVAHEINNPIGYVSSNLHSLAGYVDDLLAIDTLYSEIDRQHGAGLPDAFNRTRQFKRDVDHGFIVRDIQHLLQESREGLARVRKIVEDLKNFSRIGGTGWERVNLHEGLESTLNIVWNELKYKAEINRDYADLPAVLCIPSQINQVFLNLLTNAAQAIETHGRIGIRSGSDSENVWIEISDDGVGMSAEHLERIFDPFYTTKPVGQGTGLGLSLSWGIVQRHHGRIGVNSEEGRGTCFRVTLPIDQPLEPGTATETLADLPVGRPADTLADTLTDTTP